MTQTKKSNSRRWIWLAFVAVLILVFIFVRSLVRERLPIRAAQATHAPLISSVSTNGRVEPVVNNDLFSPLATTVKELYVQPGDQVQAGKLLLQLNDLEARGHVATAESALKAAQASLEAVTHNGTLQERQTAAAEIVRQKLERDQAQRDLNALIRLQSSGAASASEVSAAHSRLLSAESALKASQQNAQSRYSKIEIDHAKAAVAEAQAALDQARHVLAQTAVHAPVAGTVYAIGANRTEYVDEGKLLASIADLHHVRVRAYFDEPDLGRLAVGQSVQIKWSAKPNAIWKGEIERTPAAIITYGTRNVGEVLIKVDNAAGDLLPQTNVTVNVTLSSEANALSIPREALHSENGKPFVYRIEGGQLKRTPVTIGTVTLTQAAILSGLRNGDWVAAGTTSGLPLQEGVPVKVIR